MCNKEDYQNENLDQCPECETYTIKLSQDRSYEYCTRCGLLTRASTTYVAGNRINLPYGILII